MKEIKVYLLKSFGINPNGGNPAGVVLNADELTSAQKLEISSNVGFPETAFVEQSSEADFKVTFFTPTKEVDLCGHATIAVYALLLQNKLLSTGRFIQELKAGTLAIEIKNDGFVWMDQTLPEFLEILETQDINSCVNISPSWGDLKSQVVSTGLRDILLPIQTRKELDSLIIDPVKLSELNQRTNTVGLHAFTLDVLGNNYIAHTRNFAPLYGINEESATGSSNGALAAYLFKYGKLDSSRLKNLNFEQGQGMGQPSEIHVSLSIEDKNIKRVQVGGKAILIGEMSVMV